MQLTCNHMLTASHFKTDLTDPCMISSAGPTPHGGATSATRAPRSATCRTTVPTTRRRCSSTVSLRSRRRWTDSLLRAVLERVARHCGPACGARHSWSTSGTRRTRRTIITTISCSCSGGFRLSV